MSYLLDDVSTADSPETSYKDATDAHLVELALCHGIQLAPLDTALIAKNWAKQVAVNPIDARV